MSIQNESKAQGLRDSVNRVVLRAILMALSLASAAALLVGSLVVLLAFSPGTDMQDAKVFIKYGPFLAVGGIAGLLLVRQLRRALLGVRPDSCSGG